MNLYVFKLPYDELAVVTATHIHAAEKKAKRLFRQNYHISMRMPIEVTLVEATESKGGIIIGCNSWEEPCVAFALDVESESPNYKEPSGKLDI